MPQSTLRYAGNLDESFLAVGAAVPTFAGAYFGDEGELVVRLTDLADSARALGEMQQLLLDRVRVDPRKVSESRKRELALQRRWRMEKASHSFIELHQVRSQMFLSAFQDDDVVSLDIDERRGKVVVGITSAAAEARVVAARATSLAKALVIFESVNPVVLTSSTTLNYRRRPITGGYEIGPSGCTTTIGARRGSEELILTNSHCSANAWSLDGGSIRQNNSGSAPFFGAEVTDPSTYACGTLFVPRRCRHADVAAYSATGVDLFPTDTLGWAPGLIARTTFGVAGLMQTAGSTEVDSLDPHWTVIAEVNFPLWNEALHKVGVTTGWTFGSVYETCKDVRLGSHGRPLIVCADKAHLNMEPGDSGSPVFAMYGGFPNTVAFYGVGFAEDGGSSGVFSNFGQIKQDLGSNLWTF
ncbi:hypothetical protein [Gemmatimonas aurantiaca]|uniref:hypothetical protein n=1 Tax=Gemmatimonas aurantiaca TaxID=173480 RepID=UPI00301B77CA